MKKMYRGRKIFEFFFVDDDATSSQPEDTGTVFSENPVSGSFLFF
jgi:hypothetical protein